MSTEITIGGIDYRVSKGTAMEQFRLMRRLLPLVGAMQSGGEGLEALVPLASAMGAMSDADADAVLLGLLRHAQRRLDGGNGWAQVVGSGGTLQYQDTSLPDLMQIAWAVFQENFSSFSDGLNSTSPPLSPAHNGEQNG
jgi:hypothetical protein